MAYRKPAVTVIQEFVGLVPALAAFSLPTVVVGASYQLVDDDLLGTYSGVLQEYDYASLIGGAQVDLEELDSEELFPATKKPVEVFIRSAEVEIVSSQTTGAGSGTSFTDATLSQFENVLAGDLVVIVPELGVEIVSAQTNGVTTDSVGLQDRLTAGTSGQFANVKVGDTVTVTGGTNTNTGSYEVLVKISNDVLKLDANINDGVGPSTDVAYSIAGDRGVSTEGEYRVRSKTDDNTLVLESPLAEAEAPLTYSIKREVDEIALDRDPLDGFTAAEDNISLPAALEYVLDSNSFPILSGDVYANYRALRNDLAANVKSFSRLSDVQAFFGLTQITPQNPLAYGLSIQLQNTTTSVNGLGLDGNAVTDEVLSFQAAADVLALTEMYAIVVLTQNPAIHQLMKTHVEGLSQPEKRKERVVIVNRLLITEETVKDESTTSVLTSGARIIVNTQVDGSALLATPTVLNDATTDQFLNVQKGDTVVITGGTDAILGEFSVVTKNSNNQLTLDGNIVSANSTDLEYYIVRKDGLGANGTTFYDRNATFISDGVAAGMYVRILSGSLAGDHRIATITSEKELELDQVPGVTTLQTAIDYEVFRDLSKDEQATFLKGYSSALGSRRVVNVWPDIVQAPVGQTLQDLPGFYAGCSVGAMTTGLPTQQGFTNLTVSGFLGLKHSTGYFTDDQLDIIADGGTFIFGQEGDEQPLFVRHQLTSDRSAIKFQEYSVTKNVDFVAKFLRNTYKPFIGVYNIIDTTKDELKGTAKAVMTFLKDDTRLPRIGGVVRDGQLTLLEESETQIDTIKMRFKFSIPIPLNNLDITIEV